MEQTPQSFSRVLSSMCTEPHPAAREAASTFLATNPGDPGTFPEVAEMEREAVETLGEIVGLETAYGYIASGGTEANIQAVHAARNLADTDRPNMVIGASAHFSFRKAASLLGVDLRVAPTDDDHVVEVDAMTELANDDTVLIVGVAGSTEYGRVDPIAHLADLADTYDAHLHVDAAWGGFVLPFTDYEWNFAHAAIDSMTIDPHKLGRAAIPAGGFLARDRAVLSALAIETPYLHSDRQATLLGTRSGAGIASAVVALDELWPEGYRDEFERAQEVAAWLADALAGRLEHVIDPVLPIVSAGIEPAVFDALRARGWRISRTKAGELRVVVMPHVRQSMLEAFIGDLDEVITAPEQL